MVSPEQPAVADALSDVLVPSSLLARNAALRLDWVQPATLATAPKGGDEAAAATGLTGSLFAGCASAALACVLLGASAAVCSGVRALRLVTDGTAEPIAAMRQKV